MNYSTLIQSAQDGNLDAFNQLVLAYQDRLFNVAVWMLGDEDCAADAIQNAFILAFRNINRFHGGSFNLWLLRIVKNVCYDELRRRKRHPSSPLEMLLDDEEFDTPSWLSDPTQNIDDLMDTAELACAIQSGLQRLSPDQRLIITLADVDGLDYAEVAKVLGVPMGTVKSRLARARQQLRRELQCHEDLLPNTYARQELFMLQPVPV